MNFLVTSETLHLLVDATQLFLCLLRNQKVRYYRTMTEKRPASSMKPIKDLGEIGKEASSKIRQLRQEKELTAVDLSKVTKRLGREISPLAIRRIEAGARRVDVDDLVVLASALDVSPLTLMFPLGESGEERFVFIPDCLEDSLYGWWAWGVGQESNNPLISSEKFRSRALPVWFKPSEEELRSTVGELQERIRGLNHVIAQLGMNTAKGGESNG